jgi:hypothetical protein
VLVAGALDVVGDAGLDERGEAVPVVEHADARAGQLLAHDGEQGRGRLRVAGLPLVGVDAVLVRPAPAIIDIQLGALIVGRAFCIARVCGPAAIMASRFGVSTVGT